MIARYNFLFVFLAAHLFTLTTEAAAFKPGEQVYVKTESRTWMPATYLAKRNDCFAVKRATGSGDWRLEAPSERIEGEVRSGKEVLWRGVDPKSNLRVKLIVGDLSISCHEVEKLGGAWAGKSYIAEAGVIPASKFRELVGKKKSFSGGELVYAQDPVTPEIWSQYRVLSEQERCLETDSAEVLTVENAKSGELYFLPKTTLTKVKEGVSAFIRPSFSPDVWSQIEIKIKQRKKNKLTLLLPYVDGEGYFEEVVELAEIKAVPAILSEDDYLRLKPEMTVLQFVDPHACDYDSYVPRKILAIRGSCYLLRKAEYGEGSEGKAFFPEKLIANEALP